MSKLNTLHWRQHVALDVGTATTRITTGMSSLSQRPSRIGQKRALHNGVVVDGETTYRILKPLLDESRVFGIVKPRVLACAPSDARADERQLLTESILKAGAASLVLIPEPLAAAIGAGMDVSSRYAQMVIDIGEGVTDCAVIQSGKIQETCAYRQGCAHVREAIVQAAALNGLTRCDDEQAEMLMRTYGLTSAPDSGYGVLAASAAQAVVEKIANVLEAFLRDIPHRLGCDIIDSGICLTGGGALIPGIREYLEQRLQISVQAAPNPLASVAEGARVVLPVILSLNQW